VLTRAERLRRKSPIAAGRAEANPAGTEEISQRRLGL